MGCDLGWPYFDMMSGRVSIQMNMSCPNECQDVVTTPFQGLWYLKWKKIKNLKYVMDIIIVYYV
jgi:hypothetical protein